MKLNFFGISNFKAFGASVQSLPLKPITLIFGPNSAGKSSLIQSLRWTLDSAKAGDFEKGGTEGSSGAVDLGSFRSLLHRNERERQISIEFSFSDNNCIDPVKIIYNLGYNKSESLGAYYTKLHDEWDVAAEHSKIREAHAIEEGVIGVLFNYNWPDTEELLSIILDDDTCRDKIQLSMQQNIEAGYDKLFGYKHLDREPTPDDIIHAYRQSQEFLNQIHNIEKIHGKDLEVHWEKIKRTLEQERDACCVQSVEIHRGEESILRATHVLGEKDLVVEFLDEDLAKNLATTPDFWITSLSHTASRNLSSESLFSSERVIFSEASNHSTESLRATENAAAWLSYAHRHVINLERSMCYLGPLRHLPERKALLGVPGDPPADDNLKSWFRLRDQPILQKQVNRLLQRMNCRKYTFQKKIYSTGSSFKDALDSMPSNFDLDDLVEDESTRDKFHEVLLKDRTSDALADLVLFDVENKVSVSPRDVGIGISQMTPILIHICTEKEKLIAIEQPELHLHPALQSELGDVFIETALGENKNTFLLETHSEHLILRILRRIRETTEGETADWPEELRKACPDGIRPADIAVLYVEPGANGSTVKELRVNHHGEFIDEWPSGFFEERIREVF